jgi:flagellar basal-body rod protein FlgG
MLAASNRQGAAANNIANLNTTGYRAEAATTRAFASLLVLQAPADADASRAGAGAVQLGVVGTGAGVDGRAPSLVQGPLIQTSSPLDLALSGDGFFVVQTAAGPALTRDGHFGLDAQRRLVTTDGSLVLGEGGPITIGPGAIAVTADGAVSVDGREAGRLRLESYAASDLVRGGQTRFVAAAAADPQPPSATITQGALEGSNVDATQVMTDMVKVAGAFQSSQKVFQAIDATLARIVNDVARF